MSRRVSYTAEEKLKLIRYAEERGNRATGRMFNVCESNIRLWRKQKAYLLRQPLNKRADRGNQARWPDLENELKSWMINTLKEKKKLTATDIRSQAIIMARNKNIKDFTGSPSWFQRFAKRHRLNQRTSSSKSVSMFREFKKQPKFDQLMNSTSVNEGRLILIEEIKKANSIEEIVDLSRTINDRFFSITGKDSECERFSTVSKVKEECNETILN